MFCDGIKPIGDGLLEVAEERLQGLLVQEDINEIYDVEQTPFARGKFAAVRKAIHKKSGLHFAAKFLKRRRRAQSSDKEIKHEIAVLILCSGCENIVKLNAVHETRSDTALLLELATGGELQAILDDEGSLTEAKTRICMRQVLKALLFLHKRSIAHLDLKPQNILLTGKKVEEGLKLCDFGISRVIENGSKIREILGTPDYVAPEVLQYEPLSLQTDIWSVGVLTYVLLSGCSPFGGDTKQETFLNISQCSLTFPDELFQGVSHYAIDFMRSTLRVKPNDRLTAFQCLEHIWLKDESPIANTYLSLSSTSVEVTPNEQLKKDGSSSTMPPTNGATEYGNGDTIRYQHCFKSSSQSSTTNNGENGITKYNNTSRSIRNDSKTDEYDDKENSICCNNPSIQTSKTTILPTATATIMKNHCGLQSNNNNNNSSSLHIINNTTKTKLVSASSSTASTTVSTNNKYISCKLANSDSCTLIKHHHRHHHHQHYQTDTNSRCNNLSDYDVLISSNSCSLDKVRTLNLTASNNSVTTGGLVGTTTVRTKTTVGTTTSSSLSSSSASSSSSSSSSTAGTATICLFPDAPTTPKVIRKAPSDSPKSVKALVKKFQLETNEDRFITNLVKENNRGGSCCEINDRSNNSSHQLLGGSSSPNGHTLINVETGNNGRCSIDDISGNKIINGRNLSSIVITNGNKNHNNNNNNINNNNNTNNINNNNNNNSNHTNSDTNETTTNSNSSNNSTFKSSFVYCLTCGGPGCRHSVRKTVTKSSNTATIGLDQGIIC